METFRGIYPHPGAEAVVISDNNIPRRSLGYFFGIFLGCLIAMSADNDGLYVATVRK